MSPESRRGLLQELLDWFPRHARWVLAATLVLTLLAGASLVDPRTGRSRLVVDASSDRLLPEDDEERRFFDHVRSVFGSDETLLVAFASEDVFSVASLEIVGRMTSRIQALDGVDRVLSLTNAVSVRSVEGDVTIAPFVTEGQRSSAERDALRTEVLSDPLYGGSLVSHDGRVTALLVYFLEMSNFEFQERGLDAAVTAIAHEEGGSGEVWVTGGPHIRAETARILLGETLTLSLGILLALGGVLVLSFRTVRGVVLPLLTIVVAVTWTLALVALRGEPLNALTSLVPPLLTALGLSYAVHVVSEFYQTPDEPEQARDEHGQARDEHGQARDEHGQARSEHGQTRDEPGQTPDGHAAGSRARVARATRSVALPVALTGLTTAAGFASLALSPVAAVREFGWISVVGVLLTVVASLIFTPAALAVLPAPRRLPPASGGRHSVTFDRLVERLARFDVTHRRGIFALAAILLVGSLLAASQLRIGTQQISKFREDAPVRVDFEAVNERLGGANPFYVTVQSQAPEAFKEPANLRVLEELEAWLEEQPEIGSTASLVDYVKLINRGFHENDAEHFSIPDSRRLVSQLLLFGGGEQLDRFVDSRYQLASIHARAYVIDSDEVSSLVARIRARLSELPSHLEGRVTGTAVVLSGALDDIMRGQALSIAAALVIIFGILSAMFVSLRVGMLALLPNVLPVAVFFGALGLLGVNLDPGTSLIAPMVLGIAVDDTIHYFSRFIREVRRSADEGRATVAALKAVARPVTYTSLALCLGFLVLTTSELRSQVELGAMAAFALAFAWLTDLTFTPALCARLRIASLWDFLTLDLGREPHRAISLLRGLRAPQARIVALLSSVVEVHAGDRLYREGEPGEAVYAVIDGRLRATATHAGRPVELAVHERGDALGEIGFLHLDRATEVQALTDARLLRLTQDSIDQLARRYPRIASVVYRNLSGVAADRLVKLTSELRHARSTREAVPNSTESLESSRPRPHVARAAHLSDTFFGAEGASDRSALRALGDASSAVRRDSGETLVRVLEGAGLAMDQVAALALVPLAEVAWADGSLDPKERRAVLEAASAIGLAEQDAARHALGSWLERGPSPELLERWRAALSALCDELSVEARLRLRQALGKSAREVAEAAGGFLGVGTVSKREEQVLERLEGSFEPVGKGPGGDEA